MKLPDFYTDYKKNRPLDRILFLSHGEDFDPIIFHYIGPTLECAWENGLLQKHFTGYPEGLWVWDGKIVTERIDSYYYGSDCDEKPDGKERKLTQQEWELFSEDHDIPPWNESDWIEKPIVTSVTTDWGDSGVVVEEKVNIKLTEIEIPSADRMTVVINNVSNWVRENEES